MTTGRGPGSASDRRERTRTLLLDAAAQVFAESGFAGASVEAICERAGFSRGPFYYNFADKQELFLEVMARSFDSAMRDLEGYLASYAPEHGAPAVEAAPPQLAGARQDQLVAARSVEEFRSHAMRDPEAGRSLVVLLEVAYHRLGAVLSRLAAVHGTPLTAPDHVVAEVLVGVYLQAVGAGVLAGLEPREHLVLVQERVEVVLDALLPALRSR